MKTLPIKHLMTVLLLIAGVSSLAFGQSLKIEPGELELTVGDTVALTAVYTDTNENEIDTTAVWAVEPYQLATVNNNGILIAKAEGEGIVSATLGELRDSIVLIIDAPDDPDDNEFNDLVLMPRDTIVSIGDEIQYSVYEKPDSGGMGMLLDTSFIWSLEGMPVGSVSETGIFDAAASGYGLIKAELGDMSATALVIVQDSTADTVMNNITITRDSPNIQGYSVMQELTEGEIWTLGGLPHPMSVLNGGKIYFPIGSLTEDIRIHIGLPQFAEIRGDSVAWGPEGVLAGVRFNVMVNDTVREPYYFETPLIVGMVYKRGLLRNLQIDPSTLGLYFAITEDDTLRFDTTGITETVVDPDFNRIFSGVVHFSTLAVMGTEGTATSIDRDPVLPSDYALEQNYPNPFNPLTTLRYTLPEAQAVNITVYDITGRPVETLFSGYQSEGSYTLTWNASEFSSGVYFYRLQTASHSETKKMILMK